MQMTQPRTIAATEERESVVGSSKGCMWRLGLSNVKRGSGSCASLLIMNKFSCDYEGHRGFPCALTCNVEVWMTIERSVVFVK